MLLLVMVEGPAKLSVTENPVGEKFVAPTMNDTVVPGETLALGVTDGILSVRPIPTTISTLATLLCPRESLAYTLMVCWPSSEKRGVHEKFPDGPMVTVPTDEPLKESPTLYVGFVNPFCATVNENAVPGGTLVPGVIDWIDIDGGGSTVIVCETDAVFAVPSVYPVALMVNVCVPTSVAHGVHEKLPAGFMLLTEAEELGKESDN
jgi:hypothetical protein